VLPADAAFLQGLRELCDRHDALLIFDEVQNRHGPYRRPVRLHAVRRVPDVLTTAKALGCGFPIGAMLTTDELAKTLSVGTHGTTYGGNPLATAVAGAVFSVINTPEVLEGVKQRHQWFLDGLNKINQQYPIFSEIRGGGLLIGCQLTKDYAGKAKQITQLANEEGVIALIAGRTLVRFTPSLVIPEQDVKEGWRDSREPWRGFAANTQAAPLPAQPDSDEVRIMMIIRPIERRDLADLLTLAGKSGIGPHFPATR
jgi:succinylornithine aminotransferase